MKKAILTLMTSLSIVIIGYSQENSTTPTPEQYRAGIAKSIADLNIKPTSVWKINNILIESKRDSIPLRVYYPTNEDSLPILFYIHGGCWIAGDLDTHDNICRYLSNKVGCMVIAVDYRQPPENKFPAAVEDCFTALEWIYNNAGKIGGNKQKIALIGDSSGGNLSAAICLKNSDVENTVPLVMQVLINPVLDLRNNSSSFNTYMGCVLAYLNNPEESNNKYASPLASDNFKYTPRTVLITSENDESKDEAELYHKKLNDNQINANLFEIMGIGHFAGLWAGNSPEVDEAKDIVIQELQKGFKMKVPNKK
ncbi:MAG: alpha/beta hydrolase [Maribacter sp.]|nr:alpha/beta hydrolase [Maribacter sp.]